MLKTGVEWGIKTKQYVWDQKDWDNMCFRSERMKENVVVKMKENGDKNMFENWDHKQKQAWY